ncbi:unnamed protein product [Symbiodinium pilosum]|uniref:Reverse transcriptase domain-containing protein n=1 Tax=Symbiodinium pilosum TaxID=2952 RepID=A0A812M5A6_SYMPI|nr:unnamed protein product [Symbiodinium pilosum]
MALMTTFHGVCCLTAVSGRFATHAEVAYPPMLCRAMACAIREQLILLGASGPAQSLLLSDLPVHKTAQLSLSKQVGNRPTLLSPEALAFSLPALSSRMPIVKAHDLGVHDRDGFNCSPPLDSGSIRWRVDQGPVTTARHRTEVLRKWFLRAKELRDLGPDPCVCDTAAPLLQGKCMRLLRELITASEYGDNALPEDIGKGFDLLGQIPASNVLPKKTSFASPEDEQIAQEVYNLTIQEVEQGPIDDFTASLANLTSFSEETIAPHGVDVILAGLVFRARKTKLAGLSESLVAKTVDLRKAYKQLPLSESARDDAFLSVWCPSEKTVHIFQSLVLPFGSRPSVQGFYRSSHCLWHIGAKLLDLHWSLFYDDYVVVSCATEAPHLTMVLDSFFDLTQWHTSKDKETPFNAVARALGVEISLADSRAGLFRVCNTQSRKAELAANIASMISDGGASAKAFESLRGRLLFAENQIFGGSLPDQEVISSLNVEGKDGFIYELEALAAVRGVLDLCTQVVHTDLVLFLDNDAALRALIKSSSSSPVLQELLRALNEFEVEHLVRANC